MLKPIAIGAAALSLTASPLVSAECTNACSGHGDCTAFEMCNCWRNWMGNDCSQRVCGFDLAYVDTPKGDLNHNGVIDDPDQMYIENSHMYPYGTTEKWPRLTTSDHAIITETGHAYMECSNNGYCNRKTGECECLEGFEGATCQRTTCPGYPYQECSGNGVCRSKRQIAHLDNENVYELWDKHITRGCVCDKPFFGPDCSERTCPLGIDPMYLDDSATTRWQTFDLAVLTTAATKDWNDGAHGGFSTGDAYWKIIFYGRDGQKFLTDPLPAAATCNQVIDAINNLPTKPVTIQYSQCVHTSVLNDDPLGGSSAWNNVDFMDSTRKFDYSNMAFWSYNSLGDTTTERSSADSSSQALSGDIYRLHLIDTPGIFPEPEIVYVDIDGSADMMVSAGDIYTRVWSDGQHGENTDYFADHCDDVTVHLAVDPSGYTYFTDLDATEQKLLEQCLGGSDFDDSNNVGISNWDYGSEEYPHFVKIVLTVTHTQDYGYWVPLIWDSADSRFKLMVPWKRLNINSGLADTGEDDSFEIYTTKSVFSRVSTQAEVSFDFASKTLITSNVTHEFVDTVDYSGDMSCEVVNGQNSHLATMKNVSGQAHHCMRKGDKFTVLTMDDWMTNPANLNIYTVEKISTKNGFLKDNQFSGALARHSDHYGTHIIKTDIATNFAHSISRPEQFFIYKMYENVESSYTYVSECSNRGICDTDEGICNCFGGYTGNACETVSELAV